MKKDMKNKDGKKKKHAHAHTHENARSEQEADAPDAHDMVHCEDDLTVLKLEFILVRVPSGV